MSISWMHRRLTSMSSYAFPLCLPLLHPSFLTRSTPHPITQQIAVGHCRCMIHVLFPPSTYPPSTHDRKWSRQDPRILGLHQPGAHLRNPLPPRLVRRTGQLGHSFPRSMMPRSERGDTAMPSLLRRCCTLIYDRTPLLRVGQGTVLYRLHHHPQWIACMTHECPRHLLLLPVDLWRLGYQERRMNSCLLRRSHRCIGHPQAVKDMNTDT